MNLIGSFLMTILFFLWSRGQGMGAMARAFPLIGLFGGLITRPSFSLETVDLATKGHWP